MPQVQSGIIQMKVMFIPFFQPSVDGDEEEEVKKKPKKKAAAFLPNARTVTSNVSLKLKASNLRYHVHISLHLRSQILGQVSCAVSSCCLALDTLIYLPQGVLTVNLIRCINLVGHDVNAYVRFLVSDEDKDTVQKSMPVFSQHSPRWGQKFDFVMINAGSTLHVHVFSKANATGKVLSMVNVFSSKRNKEVCLNTSLSPLAMSNRCLQTTSCLRCKCHACIINICYIFLTG